MIILPDIQAKVEGAQLHEYIIVNTKTGGYVHMPHSAELPEAHTEEYDFEIDESGLVTGVCRSGRIKKDIQ